MNSNFRQKLIYINWKTEATKVNLKRDEFKEKLETFQKTKTYAKSNTKRLDFTNENTYTYSESGYWRFIYCRENKKYIIYITHKIDDTVNEACIAGTYANPGTQALRVINYLFNKYNKCTELKAFGYCDRATINKCVPKNIYYIDSTYSNKNLKHVSKADFSSHFPSNLLGDLPDWHDHMELKGTVRPTKDYPFAFYIKSGHSAEYGVYDTHTWTCKELGLCMLDATKLSIIPEDEDITILCKKSEYHFDNVINELYEAKQRNEYINGVEAKLVLNAAIGMMHRKSLVNTTYRLDHIATVVIARANQKMLDIYENLSKAGVKVLQIIVDGIIYKAPKAIGVTEKSLGALVQEVVDGQFRMKGVNQYIFFDNDNNLLQFKHGSLNANLVTDNLESIDLWRKE